jgi:hypothetical protein
VSPSGLPIASVSLPGAPSGVLPSGTYQLTFDRTVSTIMTTTGQLLDGDDSGTGGDPYLANHVFAAPTVAVVLPSFARGPGNTVNVTNASASIAATVSSTATATKSGTTVTVTTTSSLGLQIGQTVTITGMSVSAYNGTFAVRTVTNSTTFTYTATTTGLGTASGGTFTASRGIPISLSNADGIKSGEFTISFNPTMLNVPSINSGTIDPSLASSYPGASLSLNASLSNLAAGVAVIDFSSGTNALPTSGAIVLGGLTASVPSTSWAPGR